MITAVFYQFALDCISLSIDLILFFSEKRVMRRGQSLVLTHYAVFKEVDIYETIEKYFNNEHNGLQKSGTKHFVIR